MLLTKFLKLNQYEKKRENCFLHHLNFLALSYFLHRRFIYLFLYIQRIMFILFFISFSHLNGLDIFSGVYIIFYAYFYTIRFEMWKHQVPIQNCFNEKFICDILLSKFKYCRIAFNSFCIIYLTQVNKCYIFAHVAMHFYNANLVLHNEQHNVLNKTNVD